MKKLFFILASTYILSSCVATHQGAISSSSPSRNVKYQDIAYGVSETKKYLGFGGLSQDALVYEAKRELIKNRPLQANEEYLNFTVDFKNTWILFCNQTKVTMSADVVKFTNDSISNPFSEQYQNKLYGKTKINELFCIGDSIVKGNMKGVILSSINKKDKVRMMYKTNNNRIRTKKVSIDNICVFNKSYKGYKTGENYTGKIFNSTLDQITGQIVALGLEYFVVKEEKTGLLTKVQYKK